MSKTTIRRRRYGSIQDVADLWGVSSKTVRRRLADGTISGFRPPNSRLIRLDLDEASEAMQRIPTAGGGAG